MVAPRSEHCTNVSTAANPLDFYKDRKRSHVPIAPVNALVPSMNINFLIDVITNFFSIYSLLLIARILMTWFQTQSWAQQVIEFLSPVTDPYLNLFRSIIPPLGGLDLSPMLAFIALTFIQNILIGAIAFVY